MKRLFLSLAFLLASVTLVYADNWTFTFKQTRGSCGGAPGKITTENGKIKGYIISNELGRIGISGRVKDDGSFKGRLGPYGSMKGKITGNTGTGTWKAQPNCRGTITISKL